jgi:hypothetical protein
MGFDNLCSRYSHLKEKIKNIVKCNIGDQGHLNGAFELESLVSRYSNAQKVKLDD